MLHHTPTARAVCALYTDRAAPLESSWNMLALVLGGTLYKRGMLTCARMESGHLPQIDTASVSPQYYQPAGVGNDGAWRLLVLIFAISAIALGITFAGWKLCVKDCLLTWRAKRSRTTTELGFGNTPIRPGANLAELGRQGQQQGFPQ